MNPCHAAFVGLVAPLRSGAEQVRHLHGCGSHDVKHQQGKTETVKAAIELFDEGRLGDTASDFLGIRSGQNITPAVDGTCFERSGAASFPSSEARPRHK